MTEPTTEQTTEPLQLLESGAAGYCDPVTGLCVLPAALAEPGEPHDVALDDPARNVARR